MGPTGRELTTSPIERMVYAEKLLKGTGDCVRNPQARKGEIPWPSAEYRRGVGAPRLSAATGRSVRSRVVVGVSAGVVLALGLALLFPLALSLLYLDGSWASFRVPATFMIPLEATGLQASRLREVGLALEQDVYFAVTMAWGLAALLGGTPYLVEVTIASPLDSTFEGMSGFTSTGATLVADVEAETPSILFWRGMTQWLGAVVLFAAVASTRP